MVIKCGFIIVTPIISNVKSLIMDLSMNPLFDLCICFDINITCNNSEKIENNFNDINNLKYILPNDFSDLIDSYIFSNTSCFDLIKNIDIEKLLKNNKFLNVNYEYHIQKQLYDPSYKNFYASFHECPENYNDLISWKSFNDKIIDFIKNDFKKNNSLDNLNNQYWNDFYKTNNNFVINKPSTFAIFVIDYLNSNNLLNKSKKLLEFGCGNGRDLMLFNNYFNVVGLDSSIQVKELLKDKNIDVIIDSMVLYSNFDYDFYYSRFSLHALNIEEINIFIVNIKKMNTGSIFFIETRSIKGTEFENNDYYEHNFKSPIGDFHKRTLLNITYLKNKLYDSFKIIYEKDENNVAIYKDENPYVIRLILKKI